HCTALHRPLPASSLSSLSACYLLRSLHSFPTRRSSDLSLSHWPCCCSCVCCAGSQNAANGACGPRSISPPSGYRRSGACPRRPRSEEHTSELQSRFDLVCRLLLEKKNVSGDGPLEADTD